MPPETRRILQIKREWIHATARAAEEAEAQAEALPRGPKREALNATAQALRARISVCLTETHEIEAKHAPAHDDLGAFHHEHAPANIPGESLHFWEALTSQIIDTRAA